MANQTLFDKLLAEYAVDRGVSTCDFGAIPAVDFCAWAADWLSQHPPVGTGFADGNSAITIRFQDGEQYPLYSNLSGNITSAPGMQITGQPDKLGKGGIVASTSVPITGK